MKYQNRVAEYRKSKLTQVQLAGKAKISEVQIQNIEYGKHAPNVYTAIRIAKALETTVEDLFNEKQ